VAIIDRTGRVRRGLGDRSRCVIPDREHEAILTRL